MNTVSVSFSKSKIFNAFDALAVRCGYLFGEKVLFAGDAQYGVYAEELFSAKDSATSKAKYLIEHLKLHPQEGLNEEILRQFLRDLQFLQNRKHKTPQEIILLKKLEKAIDKTYTEAVKPFRAAFEHSGMSQLAYLIDEGILLAPIPADDREMQTGDTDTKGSVKLSTVLLDRFSEENPNDIYLAVREFDDFIKEQYLITGPLNGDINTQAQLLTVPLFKLPSITQMKATELQAIRKNLYAVNETFRQSMNDWSKALRTMAFHPSMFTVIQQYYDSKIAPLVQPLQEILDADERIALSHRANNHTFELSVTLYVCPVNLYWQYLTWANVLGLETMKVLGAMPDYEKNEQTSCLILKCAHRNLEQKPIEEKTEEQPVLTKRKTLDID